MSIESVSYEGHKKGPYIIINNQLVDKSTGRTLGNPALLIDSAKACVHRISDVDTLMDEKEKLINTLRQINQSLLTHLMTVEYFPETNMMVFSMHHDHVLTVSPEHACTMLNFIVTCGNRADDIHALLTTKDATSMKQLIKNIQMQGY